MSHEMLAIKLWRDGIEFSNQANGPAFFGIHFGLDKHHFDAAENQQCAEDVQNPVQPGDQRNAYADHETAHDQRAENTPKQHPMLIDRKSPEVGEDKGDDENVIHRKRESDEIAGDKLQAFFLAARTAQPDG